MAANQDKAAGKTGGGATDDRDIPIDLTAPAGSKDALGAESIRDGRPTTRDEVVEAIDEQGPESGG